MRLLIWVGTVALLGTIAASRLILGLHSAPEIIIAFVIGAAAIVVFMRRLGDRQPIKLDARAIVFFVLLLFVARYLPPINGEGLIAHAVWKLDKWPAVSFDE
jgi:hypothetical protein